MGMKPRPGQTTKWSQPLAERVRVALGPRDDVFERRMFGGLCFMVGGHMTVGIDGDKLMARVGPDRYEAALDREHARPMDFTGRPLKGMLWVDADGTRTTRRVKAWVDLCLEFTESLPPR